MTTDKELNELIDDTTLRILRAVSDKTDLAILRMLPTELPLIMMQLGITKMPVNARVNALEQIGLVIRYRGTGKVEATELTKHILELIDYINEKVKKSIVLWMN